MELFLVAMIAMALYLIGVGRRTKRPPITIGAHGYWAAPVKRGLVNDLNLDELKDSFSRFADEREGRRIDRAHYEGPRVAYLHRAARAVMSLHVVARDDGREDRFTQIAYAVPTGWRHRMEIGPASPDEILESPVPGLVRVATGESEFDRRTRILASDATFARDVLDPSARRALTDLRELLANDHVHLSASASRIFLRKRGVVRDLPDLSLFARLCDAVYDRLLVIWERENGIEILDETDPLEPEGTKCQVCSHPMAADASVRCRRCRTPHHTDCWDFNGGCATFACGEKQWLKGAA